MHSFQVRRQKTGQRKTRKQRKLRREFHQLKWTKESVLETKLVLIFLFQLDPRKFYVFPNPLAGEDVEEIPDDELEWDEGNGRWVSPEEGGNSGF